MDDVAWPALTEGHVERVQDEAGAQVAGHRPIDNGPAEGVEHDGVIEEPRPGRDVGDIGNPQPVGCIRGELPLDQVRRRPGAAVASCCADTLASLTPASSAARSSLATRLRPTRRPSATNSAWMRGAP